MSLAMHQFFLYTGLLDLGLEANLSGLGSSWPSLWT